MCCGVLLRYHGVLEFSASDADTRAVQLVSRPLMALANTRNGDLGNGIVLGMNGEIFSPLS